jgi:hypothetical protein
MDALLEIQVIVNADQEKILRHPDAPVEQKVERRGHQTTNPNDEPELN